MALTCHFFPSETLFLDGEEENSNLCGRGLGYGDGVIDCPGQNFSDDKTFHLICQSSTIKYAVE